jgi:hypothetical protein
MCYSFSFASHVREPAPAVPRLKSVDALVLPKLERLNRSGLVQESSELTSTPVSTRLQDLRLRDGDPRGPASDMLRDASHVPDQKFQPASEYTPTLCQKNTVRYRWQVVA